MSNFRAQNAFNNKKDVVIIEDCFFPRHFYKPNLLKISSYITWRLLNFVVSNIK
jgi:hypothetical protein